MASPPDHRPEQIDRHPAQTGGTKLMQSQQPEPEHHKREGSTVVETRFAGQAEPQPITVVGIGDLDFGGKNRIGRRQNGPQEQRGAERETEPYDTRHCYQAQRKLSWKAKQAGSVYARSDCATRRAS